VAPKVLRDALGNSHRAAYEPGDPLTQGVVELRALVSFPGELGTSSVLGSGTHASVSRRLLRMLYRPLTIPSPSPGPQVCGSVLAAVPDLEGTDLARLCIHGDPDCCGRGLSVRQTAPDRPPRARAPPSAGRGRPRDRRATVRRGSRPPARPDRRAGRTYPGRPRQSASAR
jgi:hypothetical protein